MTSPFALDPVRLALGDPTLVAVDLLAHLPAATARVARLLVRFSDARAPLPVIAKHASADGLAAAARELRFYRHLAPRWPSPTPALLGSHATADSLLLLTEDLTAAGYTLRDTWSRADLDATIDTLVRLHTTFWNDLTPALPLGPTPTQSSQAWPPSAITAHFATLSTLSAPEAPAALDPPNIPEGPEGPETPEPRHRGREAGGHPLPASSAGPEQSSETNSSSTRQASALDTRRGLSEPGRGVPSGAAPAAPAFSPRLSPPRSPAPAPFGDPADRALLASILPAWHTRFLERVATRRALTLGHGDFHLLGNIFFPTDATGATPRVIDWSEVKPALPTHDLAYVLHAPPAADRAARDRALLRRYHDGLLAAGITDYPWPLCQWDHAFSLITCLFQAVLQNSPRWFRVTAGLVDLHDARASLRTPPPL